jgi:hypothetical protein
LELRNDGDLDVVSKRHCPLECECAVWRIEDGKAVRAGDRLCAGPEGVPKSRGFVATWPRRWYNRLILVRTWPVNEFRAASVCSPLRFRTPPENPGLKDSKDKT